MPVARQALSTEFAVGRGRINLSSHTVGFQFFHGIEHLHHDGSGPDETNDGAVTFGCAPKQVHAFHDAFVDPLGFGRHGIVFVVHGNVVNDILVVNVHLFDAVTDDRGQLVGEGWVPSPNGWIGVGHEQRVAVLVL